MKWHPDVPDLPINKPKQIEHLEKMAPSILEAMTQVEIDETIAEIAHAVAKAYKEQVLPNNYDECLEIVSIALTVTGSSIGGHLGNSMIAASEHATKEACRLVFAKEEYP